MGAVINGGRINGGTGGNDFTIDCTGKTTVFSWQGRWYYPGDDGHVVGPFPSHDEANISYRLHLELWNCREAEYGVENKVANKGMEGMERMEGDNMNNVEFTDIVEKRMDKCRMVLGRKRQEYADDGYGECDRFHNFIEAGKIMGKHPVFAWFGMWSKHLVSVVDIVKGFGGRNRIPDRAMLDEKITDLINYLLLLEGMIEEARAKAGDGGMKGRSES